MDSLGSDPGSITKASFSPDGRLLVAGTNKGRLLIWNVETQQLVANFRPPIMKL